MQDVNKLVDLSQRSCHSGRMKNQKIKDARTLRGWSLRTAAMALDVHYSTIHRWETGSREISLENALAVVSAYPEISLNDLIAAPTRDPDE